MAKFIIEGGVPLKGTIRAAANKNAVLPIMAACLLTENECVLENVPKIGDVLVLGSIMKGLGVKVEGLGTETLRIKAGSIKSSRLEPSLVAKLRASILLMGPLLSRVGEARMRHPGGCLIGRRAVGTHFDALSALGAKIMVGEEDYEAEIKKPKGANIFLDEVSVTATENALLLAARIPGKTVIENAASEPHVQDLCQMLSKMGVKINGIGTNKLEVFGKKKLSGIRHRISSDNIEVGTLAIAAAVTGGRIKIQEAIREHLRMPLLYLNRMGVKTRFVGEDVLEVWPEKLVAPGRKVQTRPWPGFPTDLMSPLIVLGTQAKGATLFHDWMFESRMFFVDKLITMGADIILCDPHRVLVNGPTKLRGKNLVSPDIRAGIALLVAALCARGESQIEGAELIERGFEEVDSRFASLGAKIKREE